MGKSDLSRIVKKLKGDKFPNGIDNEFDDIALWLEQKMAECGQHCIDDCGDHICPYRATWNWLWGLELSKRDASKEWVGYRDFCRYRTINIDKED